MQFAKIFGVKVQVSPYFFALLALYTGLGVWPQALAIFILVFVHEWVHIIVAKGYGIQVEAVELLPFGGVARLAGMFEADPAVETIVALAGPAANLFLALVGVVLARTGWLVQELTDYFIQANLAVALFNLLPALPLDGGRVLRAWLTGRVGYRKATHQAAMIGKGVGAVVAVAGIICLVFKYTDFTPALVGAFIFLAAGKEEKQAQFIFIRYLTRKKEELVKNGALNTFGLAVRPDHPVKDVIRRVLPQRFMLVHIVGDNFKIEATYTETQVIRALFEQGIDFPVGHLDKLP